MWYKIYLGEGEKKVIVKKLLLSFLDGIITHQNRQIKRLEEDFRIVSRKFIITLFLFRNSYLLIIK